MATEEYVDEVLDAMEEQVERRLAKLSRDTGLVAAKTAAERPEEIARGGYSPTAYHECFSLRPVLRKNEEMEEKLRAIVPAMTDRLLDEIARQAAIRRATGVLYYVDRREARRVHLVFHFRA